MSYLDFSDDEIMTRKEYLKSKKKFKLPSIKTILIIIVIILLSIYVTKQIKTYNTVTLAAKKVMEESSLLKTLKIYYMNDSYTKDSSNILTVYVNQDESRIEYKNTESMTNITYSGGYIYGIKNNSLCRVNIDNNNSNDSDAVQFISKDNVIGYEIYLNDIFIIKYNSNNSKINGLYKLNLDTNNTIKIIDGNIYQLVVNENNIYVVMPANTIKSIVKFDKYGKSKEVLTTNEIVSYISLVNNNILFTNQIEKGKIYLLDIKSKNIIKLAKEIYGKYITTQYGYKINGSDYLNMYEGNIIYLSPKDSKIYSYNLTTKESTKLFTQTTNGFELVNSYIYFKDNNNLKVLEYSIKDKTLNTITSIRSNEFICIR